MYGYLSNNMKNGSKCCHNTVVYYEFLPILLKNNSLHKNIMIKITER